MIFEKSQSGLEFLYKLLFYPEERKMNLQPFIFLSF